MYDIDNIQFKKTYGNSHWYKVCLFIDLMRLVMIDLLLLNVLRKL